MQSLRILQKSGWGISEKSIVNGLLSVVKNTGLLGRWQTLGSSPTIICDTGHNEDGVKAIFSQIKQIKYKNLHIVFGVVNDKDLDSNSYLASAVAREGRVHPL